MKNNIDLIELLANRRKTCRLHITNIEQYINITSTLQNLDRKLITNISEVLHDNNQKDTDNFYVYVGYNEQDVLLSMSYDKNGDHKKLGELFGYPKCCIRSFCNNRNIVCNNDDEDYKYWQPAFTLGQSKLNLYNLRKLFNMTQQSKNTFHPLMNPALNLLAHFPCSLDCSKSIALAKWRAQFKYNFKYVCHSFVFDGNTFNFTM